MGDAARPGSAFILREERNFVEDMKGGMGIVPIPAEHKAANVKPC